MFEEERLVSFLIGYHLVATNFNFIMRKTEEVSCVNMFGGPGGSIWQNMLSTTGTKTILPGPTQPWNPTLKPWVRYKARNSMTQHETPALMIQSK